MNSAVIGKVVMMSVTQVTDKLLNNSKLCLLVAIISFLCLHLPAINSGLSMDDFIFLSEVQQGDNNFELYNFDKTLEGLKPWWTHVNHKLFLFRPLSSFLFALDYKMFGENYYLWHAHSILWGFFLILGCWYLFHSTISRKAANLAVIVLASSCFISWSVDYLAQRNHLVSIVAGVWALFFYIKWRIGKLKKGRLLSLLAIVIGLLGGEYCLTLILYLFAFEVSKSKLRIKENILNTWPILLVLICYLIILKVVGSGTYGMPGYLHPISEPFAYIQNLPKRLVSLVSLLFNRPTEFLYYQSTFFYYFAFIVIILSSIYYCLIILSDNDQDNSRDVSAIYWYASGTILSLLPIASTIPHVRLVSCGAIGYSAIIGVMISYYLTNKNKVKRPIWLVFFVIYWLFFLFICSPKCSLSIAQGLKLNNLTCLNLYGDAVDNKTIEQNKYTVVINGPSYHCVLILPKICKTHNYIPLGYEILTASQNSIYLNIVDSYSFEITSQKGSLLDSFVGKFFRNSDRVNQFKVGDIVTDQLFSANIVRLEDGLPTKIKFTFTIPIDSPSIQFVVWNNDRLVPISLPKTSDEVLLLEPYTKGILW